MQDESWEIGEFVTYELQHDNEEFKIIIKGPDKYRVLISNKINEIKISRQDLIQNDLIDD